MKVLHIVSEFSKKNYSISALVFFYYEKLKSHYQLTIANSYVEKKIFDLNGVKIVTFKNLLSLFKVISLKNMIKENDFIHIHGLWSPIQMLSIIISIFLKKRLIIHPHGMLLKEAIKTGNFTKNYSKIISLFILQKFINTEVSFVAITSQESNAINYFFPQSYVKKISNPLPFKINKNINLKKKKVLTYFGRIHPHKNIDLLIDSFIEANLSSDWKLEIYGIGDDVNYLKKIKIKAQNFKNINIYPPIFGKKKIEKMSSAWLNILVSKSEVLSLTILEAATYSLPSLVNKKIEVIKKNDGIIFSETNVKSIAKKINEITSWTKEERDRRGKHIKQDTIKGVDIKSNYRNLYLRYYKDHNKKQSLNINTFINIFYKYKSFIFNSTNYAFNLMYASLSIITLVLFGYYELAGELGLFGSFFITFTQVLSSNIRATVISENNINIALRTLLYRFLLIVISSIIFYYILYFELAFVYKDIIFSFSFLILSLWMSEMKLAILEIQKKINFIKIIFISNTLFIILTLVLLLFNKFLLLNILLLSYSSLSIFICLLDVTKEIKKINKNSIRATYQENIKTIALGSSFTVVLSSFIWRLTIFYLFDKAIAGILYASFAIGSFPGTFFNSIIGPTFVKLKLQISNIGIKLINFIFTIIFILIAFIIIKIINQENFNYSSSLFVIFATLISLFGSLFMVKGMHIRHLLIQSSKKNMLDVFRFDIIYGMSISTYVFFLYFIGGTLGVAFAFLASSVTALYFYSNLYYQQLNT
jgi:glycosyltransferase involved in cell wall biosynthesis